VVLAYSGGLDTSVILRWLIETYDCEVVTFSADIGQTDSLDNVEANAMKTGAVKAYVDDLKETFVKDYVFPAFRANVIYEGQYLMGTSIARPLIAKRQMEIAALEGRRCGQPRRHRQRQRPGPLRAGLLCHQPGH
jgi:argininosuccinate synthase